MNIDTSIAKLYLQTAQLSSHNDTLRNRAESLTQEQKDDIRLKEQTDAFEAILINIMLKDAIKNENPLYPKQAGSDIYHSMYLEQLSQNLSGHFGYSQMLFDYLKEQQNGRK